MVPDTDIAAALRAALLPDTYKRIAVQRGEVIGLADDGVTVTLGVVWSTRDLTNLLSYLTDAPRPENW